MMEEDFKRGIQNLQSSNLAEAYADFLSALRENPFHHALQVNHQVSKSLLLETRGLSGNEAPGYFFESFLESGALEALFAALSCFIFFLGANAFLKADVTLKKTLRLLLVFFLTLSIAFLGELSRPQVVILKESFSRSGPGLHFAARRRLYPGETFRVTQTKLNAGEENLETSKEQSGPEDKDLWFLLDLGDSGLVWAKGASLRKVPKRRFFGKAVL